MKMIETADKTAAAVPAAAAPAAAATAAPALGPAAAAEARYLLPVYAQTPIEPVSGRGVVLRTHDGRDLLDFYGGHAVALLGYAHPRLLAALAAQAQELFFQSNIVPLEVRARAACRLDEFAPNGLGNAFLVNSGAEANENALKLAFRHTGRAHVVALHGSFHGRTAAAAAVSHGSGNRAVSWYGLPRAPFDVTFVPVGDLAALEAALASAPTAALIAEPVQGLGGAVSLGADYLAAARELTRRSGTLLIFDEVQCGMGRTGQPFAAQTFNVTPDLLTTAKGLAGGFPAGAVLMTAEVAAGVRRGDLGSTFGGGPMACALIETVIDTIEEEGLLARVRQLSQRIRETCQVGPVTAIQGEGFLLGLRTTRPGKDIVGELLARGILTGTCNDPNVVRLLPALVLEAEHVDRLAAALAEIGA
jgi:acetylornithine/succinyldiaminopimelate/putrescine aminotransferase